MIRLTRAQVQPIGLDIGHDSIKMLQLEVTGESLSVVAAARRNFPAEVRNDPALRMPAAVELVRQMLREHPFHGKSIVAALPRDILSVKNLRLPNMPENDLAEAVRFEQKNIFSFDTDDAQMHFLPVGEVRQGGDILQEVIVLAAKNEDLNNYVEQLHRCGVIVDGLDAEPCALYRGIERFIRRREDEQEVYVLVDLGFRRSQVIIGKGRDISFFKLLDIGGIHLHQAVAKKLGITVDEAQGLRQRLTDNTDADSANDPVRQAVFDSTRSVLEELAREIALCLRYYSVTFRGHRPSRVRLLGGEAADPQVQSIFNSVLPVAAEPGKPLYSVNVSKMKPQDRLGAMSQWALAMSLGLKRTTGKFGARDGKPRDPAAPVTSTVKEVDLGKALQTLATDDPAASTTGGTPAANAAASRSSTAGIYSAASSPAAGAGSTRAAPTPTPDTASRNSTAGIYGAAETDKRQEASRA